MRTQVVMQSATQVLVEPTTNPEREGGAPSRQVHQKWNTQCGSGGPTSRALQMQSGALSLGWDHGDELLSKTCGPTETEDDLWTLCRSQAKQVPIKLLHSESRLTCPTCGAPQLRKTTSRAVCKSSSHSPARTKSSEWSWPPRTWGRLVVCVGEAINEKVGQKATTPCPEQCPYPLKAPTGLHPIESHLGPRVTGNESPQLP